MQSYLEFTYCAFKQLFTFIMVISHENDEDILILIAIHFLFSM